MMPMHVFINHNDSGFLLLRRIPCAECGYQIRPIAERNAVLTNPVLHAMQYGICPRCSAQHAVVSAKTKEHCRALEPILARVREVVGG